MGGIRPAGSEEEAALHRFVFFASGRPLRRRLSSLWRSGVLAPRAPGEASKLGVQECRQAAARRGRAFDPTCTLGRAPCIGADARTPEAKSKESRARV